MNALEQARFDMIERVGTFGTNVEEGRMAHRQPRRAAAAKEKAETPVPPKP